MADSKQLPTKESVKKRGHLWLTYLLAALYADSEQSPTVALSTAGDAAHLRGRGQVCALQQEIRMEEKEGEWFAFGQFYGGDIAI